MPSAPTKGNLKIIEDKLTLSRSGFELLDKKQNILLKEMMNFIKKTKEVQEKINLVFDSAYSALIFSNLELGINNVEQLSYAVKINDSININYRNIMGVEIPIILEAEEKDEVPPYSFKNSSSSLDEAILLFRNARKLTAFFAQIETSIFRLADSIKKTQKRTNSLKNIMIPRFEEEIKFILNSIEEKEREEFSRLKIIKNDD